MIQPLAGGGYVLKKDAKFYIIYSIIILIFIISGAKALNAISNIAQKTYNPFPLAQISFSILFLFGAILGFESLFNEKNKVGWILTTSFYKYDSSKPE